MREGGFTNFVNPIERIKPASKSSIRSQCRKTIYEPPEQFIVRARWGGQADQFFGVTEEDRRSGKPLRSQNLNDQEIMDMHISCVSIIIPALCATKFEYICDRIIHVLDRPGSFSVLLQKKTGLVRNNG